MKLGQIVATSRLTPTMEAIAFQNDEAFTSQLQAVITKFVELTNEPNAKDVIEGNKDLKDEFCSLIKDRFGIKCSLHTTSLIAATIPNVYIKHSPMVRKYLGIAMDQNESAMGRGEISTLPEVTGIGTVNMEAARLGGWFSEQTVPIFLNFVELVSKKLTPGEITAGCLHEIGHIFEGAASCNRINQTNQIVSDIAKRMLGPRKPTDTEYVFHELRKLDGNISRDTVDGLMSGNAVVMGTSAFRVITGAATAASLSGSSLYNDTSFEAMADSFAIRFGYGTELATGLQKVTTVSRIVESFSELLSYVVVLILISSIVSLMKVVFAGAATGVILAALLRNALIVATMINGSRLSNTDMEYDEMVDRLDRIRRNVIEQLKQVDISAADKKNVLLQLQTIEDVRKTSFNTPRFLRELSKLVFSSDRRNQRSINAQQEVEKLIANEIFVSAAKLDTLKA